MKLIRSTISFLLLSLLSIEGLAFAETDAKGCKDHPLFNRMSGFTIYQCKKSFDQMIIKVDNDLKSEKNLKSEGDLTSISYIFKKSADMPSPPSDLQVMRNYQNAAKQKGGEVIVDKSGYTALKFNRESGTVYAVVRTGSAGYRLYLEILEEKEMTQEVTANLMWESFKKTALFLSRSTSIQIKLSLNQSLCR